MPLSKLQQQLTEEETKLERSLSRIYRNIKRDLNIKLTSGFIQWTDIDRIYRPQINDAVRSAVTEMYHIAAKKTVEKDIRVPFFLTQRDMDEIVKLTRKYQDWTMIGLERELIKKTSMAFDPQTLLRVRPDYDLVKNLKDTFIPRMTQSLHGEVAARAVLTKSRQVVVRNQNNRNNRVVQFRRGSLSKGEYRSAQGIGPHYRWVTAEDERVCEVCAPLDGTTYLLEEAGSVPLPVEDTHPRCRCEVQFVDEDLATREDLYLSEDVLFPEIVEEIF